MLIPIIISIVVIIFISLLYGLSCRKQKNPRETIIEMTNLKEEEKNEEGEEKKKI